MASVFQVQKKHPKIAEERIKESVSLIPQAGRKHILTELVEYAIVLQLRSELYGAARFIPKPYKTIEKLPTELEKNSFISFFLELIPDDIVDRAMKQLEFYVPKDVEVNYLSPVPIGRRTSDPNTFRINFKGKFIEVSILTSLSSLFPISSMTSGPAPEFEQMYIRKYWEKKLLDKLQGLWRATFSVRVVIRLKLRYGLILKLPYADWAEDWTNRFLREGSLGGFDFYDFRKTRMNSLLINLYEDSRETNMLVKRLADYKDNDA